MSGESVSNFYSWIDRYGGGFRHGLFIFTLVVALAYLLSGYPFAPLFDNVVDLRAGFRIAFGVVLLASLVRSRDSLPILYGNEVVRQKQHRWMILSTYHLQFLILASLVFGFLTDVTALALLGVRIVFIERTRRFGLENTLYQVVIVHLPFLGLGASFSVDSAIGLEPIIPSPIMFNSLFVLVGIMTVSGAYHKVSSKIWLRGDAVGEFLKLPHLRLAMLRGVNMELPSSVSSLLSYTMILGQLLLLFSLVNRWVFLAVCCIFVGFSISMFAIVDLSYIGQTFLTVFVLYGGAVVLYSSSYPPLRSILVPMVTPYTVLAILVAVLGLLTVLENDVISGTPLNRVARILSGQNAPVKPFNEQHLQGVHTFRLLYEDPETRQREPVLEVFDSDGWQKQFFHPRYFQASVYVVTDYCLALHHDVIDLDKKESELVDLCCAGLYAAGETAGRIYVQVKVFDGDQRTYLEDEWKMLGVCQFDEDGATWEVLNDPPVFETHPRLDFDFDNA